MEYDVDNGVTWQSFPKITRANTNEILVFEAETVDLSLVRRWTSLAESPVWSRGRDKWDACAKIAGYGSIAEMSAEGFALWTKQEETEVTSRFPFVFTDGHAYSVPMFEIYVPSVPSLFELVKTMAPFACMTYISILEEIIRTQCSGKRSKS